MTNLFLAVLENSISVGIIVVALLLLTPFLNKRYAAKWKYWIWIFLALRLIAPFGVAGRQLAGKLLPQMKTQGAPEAEKTDMDAFTDQAAPKRVVVEIPQQMTTPIAMQAQKNSVDITLLDIVACIWMAGCIFCLSVHFISYFHYKNQIRKRGKVITDSGILCLLLQLRQELCIKCSVRAVEYPKAASPMMLGFFKPVLVLPKEQYNPGELYFILKHELVHVSRRDMYAKLLFAAAHAACWFHPLIWAMHKEAVIDMELSCDERVVQGADFAGRKAYTETLLATLHKRCTKKTVLSTQFYGGKQIMKKRFKNILVKTAKRNGASIFMGAVIITVGMGTLVGCSAAKEHEGTARHTQAAKNAGNVKQVSAKQESQGTLLGAMAGRWVIDFDQTGNLWGSGISNGNGMEISKTGALSYYIGISEGGTGQCEEKEDGVTVEIEPYESHSSKKETLTLHYAFDKESGEQLWMDYYGENVYWKRESDPASGPSANDGAFTAVLTFSKEGETQQKNATLITGDGYSLYLPDGEWQQSDTDIWTATANAEVRLWVIHHEDESVTDAEQELQDNGFEASEDGTLVKQEEETVCHAKLYEDKNALWGIFYCYPAEAEEGFGRELPVIADTFAVLVPAGGGQDTDIGSADTATYLEAADRQQIREIVDEFAKAYFAGNAGAIRKFLVNPDGQDISTYHDAGRVSDFTVKGLSDAQEHKTGDGAYVVSLEYRDSVAADTFRYLTFSFVRQEDGWKVQSYGLEA